MQKLATEIENEGLEFTTVLINNDSADYAISFLISLCDFPIFQDISSVDAWGQHAGGKDDIIIYNSDGTLSTFLKYGGSLNTYLASPAGYANLKAKILEAY
jgi:hypothetical protein